MCINNIHIMGSDEEHMLGEPMAPECSAFGQAFSEHGVLLSLWLNNDAHRLPGTCIFMCARHLLPGWPDLYHKTMSRSGDGSTRNACGHQAHSENHSGSASML